MPSNRINPAPLLLPVIAWITGIILARILSFYPLTLAIGSLIVLLGAVALPKLRFGLLLLLFVFVGALRYSVSVPQPSSLQAILGIKAVIQQRISFRVIQEFSATEHRYAVELDSLAGKPLHDKLIFNATGTLAPGERYGCLAKIQPLVHDPILHIYPQMYSALANQLGKAEQISKPTSWFSIAALRHKLLHNLDNKLGANAGWAKGLLLSDTESKREYGDMLSQAGIMHLIVVSGMHVWFIYIIVVTILRSFMPRTIAEICFLAFILGFAALNNWAPPVSRAIIMISTFTIARWMQRPITGAQSLSLSLFIITLINPSALFAVGLQLSFVCMVVILFGLPRIRLFPGDNLEKYHWQRFLESILEGAILSLLVSIAIAPLTLYHFGRISLNGVIGNIIGIPLIAMLLPISGLILLLPESFFLFGAIENAYQVFVWLWQLWVRFSANMPLNLGEEYFSLSSTLALVVLILWGFILIRGLFKPALIALLPTLLLAGSLYYFPRQGGIDSDIHVFSCGVADCSLIRMADGTNLMIDTGGGKDFTLTNKQLSESALLNDSWLNKNLLPWLGRNRINRVDYLVLTHLHADHYGGLLSLMQAVKVKNIIISAATEKQPLWYFFSSHKSFNNTTIKVISDTCSIAIGSGNLKILHPDKDFYSNNENERSIVCRLDYLDQRFLFTGDIGAPSEEYLSEKYPHELACNYLKTPHHGSKGSSTEEFLSLAHPQEAWLCTSANNRFGFPHKDTIQRYYRQQVRLRSTAEGSIRKKIDSHRENKKL